MFHHRHRLNETIGQMTSHPVRRIVVFLKKIRNDRRELVADCVNLRAKQVARAAVEGGVCVQYPKINRKSRQGRIPMEGSREAAVAPLGGAILRRRLPA